MWILSLPVVSVLLPAFAACSRTDPPRTARLFDWGLRTVALLLFPAALLLATFAAEILRFWLGVDFATHGAPVLRLLAIGMFVNGLAQVALALVQGSGRPDLGARLHLVELPLYLTAVWLLIRAHGIEGAAMAWLGRVTVDAIAIFFLAARQLPRGRAGVPRLALVGGAALLTLVVGCVLPGLVTRALFAGTILLLTAAAGWRLVAIPGLQVLRDLGPASSR